MSKAGSSLAQIQNRYETARFFQGIPHQGGLPGTFQGQPRQGRRDLQEVLRRGTLVTQVQIHVPMHEMQPQDVAK